MLELIVINDSLIALLDPDTNGLDIYKLDVVSPEPQLQKLCSLEFPQLIPNAWVNLFEVDWERIPTSKCCRRSESSQRCHVTFYSSTVGTIGLHLGYFLLRWRKTSHYAMIINVAKLLSAIPTDVRSVPWEDWGPSSTHIFERSGTTTPISAGPFWITHLSPLTVRDYDLLRIRYAQTTAEGTPSSYSHQLVDTSTETHNEYLETSKVETHLRYRDVVANHLDFGRFKGVVADREWIVGITNTVSWFCLNTLRPSHWSLTRLCKMTGRKEFCCRVPCRLAWIGMDCDERCPRLVERVFVNCYEYDSRATLACPSDRHRHTFASCRSSSHLSLCLLPVCPPRYRSCHLLHSDAPLHSSGAPQMPFSGHQRPSTRSHPRRELPSVHSDGFRAVPVYSSTHCSPFLVIILY